GAKQLHEAGLSRRFAAHVRKRHSSTSSSYGEDGTTKTPRTPRNNNKVFAARGIFAPQRCREIIIHRRDAEYAETIRMNGFLSAYSAPLRWIQSVVAVSAPLRA